MSKKNAVLAVADDLAAKSRILRKAATDPDVVVSKLHALGMEHSKQMAERKQSAAAEAVASIQPMIERARQQLAGADAAREEAREFVKKFENVKWDVLRDRFNEYHGVTPETPLSTRNRIAQIRAAVEELGAMAATDDGDLRRFLTSASALEEIESHKARYAINGLHQRMSLSADAGQTIRNRITGIKRHLEALGAVLVTDVVADAPQAQEVPSAPPTPLESASVPPLWDKAVAVPGSVVPEWLDEAKQEVK